MTGGPGTRVLSNIQEALRTPDAGGLSVLVDEHWGSMHRLARLLGDPSLADDIVRDAWTDAVEHAGDAHEELSMRAWLLSLVIDCLSAIEPPPAAPPAVRADELYGEDHRWAGHWRDGRPAAWEADVAEVEAALAQLPAGVAAVVLLRDVEGLSAREVELLVGRSAEEQLVLLHHGRTAVRATLGADA